VNVARKPQHQVVAYDGAAYIADDATEQCRPESSQ